MKRLMTLWMMSLLMVLTFPAMAAMSTSKMRQHSRFLTDRMAYELNLSSSQYDDVYEVNYDFLSRTRYLIDDVTAGYTSALDEYYDYLDVRNDDLRWILTSSQYRRFLEKEYFYRPIYTTTSGTWGFRIYRIYTDITHFYFGKPSHYSSYKGAHYRSNFNNVSYYKQQHRERYQNNDVYQGNFTMGKTMKQEQQNRPNGNSGSNGNNRQNGNPGSNVSNPQRENQSTTNMSRPNSSSNQTNVNNNSSRPNSSSNQTNKNNNNSNQTNKKNNNNGSARQTNSSNQTNVSNGGSTRNSRGSGATTSRSRSNNSNNTTSNSNNSGRSSKRSR